MAIDNMVISYVKLFIGKFQISNYKNRISSKRTYEKKHKFTPTSLIITRVMIFVICAPLTHGDSKSDQIQIISIKGAIYDT